MPSAISREWRRDAAPRGGVLHSCETMAQGKVKQVAKRPRLAKLAENER